MKTPSRFVWMGLFVLAVACNPSRREPNASPGDAGVDAGSASALQRSPDDQGFCCPIEAPSCECFRNGGFVEVDDPGRCPAICDLGPDGATVDTDAHGCEVLWGPDSCL